MLRLSLVLLTTIVAFSSASVDHDASETTSSRPRRRLASVRGRQNGKGNTSSRRKLKSSKKDNCGGGKGEDSCAPSMTPSAVASSTPTIADSSSPTAECDALCPNGGTVEYRFDSTKMNFEGHLINSRNMGCDLASVPDADTGLEIQTFLQNEGVLDDDNHEFIFLGGYIPVPVEASTDTAPLYVWTDGSDNTYLTNKNNGAWLGGANPEPNNGGNTDDAEWHMALLVIDNVFGGGAVSGLTWFDVPTVEFQGRSFLLGALYKCCTTLASSYESFGECPVDPTPT